MATPLAPPHSEWLPGHWYIACRSRDLKRKPLVRQLGGLPTVLFRNAQGQAGALLDRCPHRQIPLSQGWVQQGALTCRYHGWQFAIDGNCTAIPGRCEGPPKTAHRASAWQVCEQQGFVWVCAGEPGAQPYVFPGLGDHTFGHFIWEVEVPASLLCLAENFLDGMHTHYVHAGLIRTPRKRQRMQVEVERGADGVEARYLNESTLSGLIYRLLAPGVRRLDVFGRFQRPGLAQLEYRTDRGDQLYISVFGVPEHRMQTRAYVVTTFQTALPHWLAHGVGQPLFALALYQDKRILQLQTQTLQADGQAHFVSTELDVLGPHIQYLLAQGVRPASPLIRRLEIET